MKFVFDDGGRSLAGFKGNARDCVCRSIAIATGLNYADVYAMINSAAIPERPGKRKRGKSSARTGVHKATIQKVLIALGWKFTPCMGIGTGCTVHLIDGELPMGRLIVSVSKHYTAVIDGVIHDTHDPQRSTMFYHGNKLLRVAGRCVYGYWSKPQCH